MTETARSPHYATLAATPGIFRAMLAVMDDEKMAWKASPERWSVAEVLAHMTHVERRNLGLRARTIAVEELPELVDYDQMAEYARGTYSGGTGTERLEELSAVREESLAFLRELPAEAWKRRGRHPEVGDVTIRQILRLWAFHDLSHIRQVAEIVKATCFWEGVGSLRHYYGVNP